MDGVAGARGYGSLSAAVLRQASDAPKSERDEIVLDEIDVTKGDVSAETSAADTPRPIGQLGHHFDVRM